MTQKKHNAFKSKNIVDPFSITTAVFIISSFHWARWLMKLIIWEFWGVWGMWCEENDQKYGLQEHNTSTMTLHRPTQHCQFESSQQSIWVLSFHNLPNHLTYPLRTFIYLQNKNDPQKEEEFKW
jgi:hypothetical protein